MLSIKRKMLTLVAATVLISGGLAASAANSPDACDDNRAQDQCGSVTQAAPTVQRTGPGMSIWHHRWEGPKLRDYPADVKDELATVVLGLAQSAGGGAIKYGPGNGQSPAAHAADIRSFEARGIKVLLGFGGSSDRTTVTTTAEADRFAASVVSLQRTYGFTGVDVDLEPSGSRWTEPALVYGLRKAQAQVEKRCDCEFGIGLTVGLYGEHTARWLSLARALGPDLDYMAPMLYDFPESRGSRLTAVTLDSIRTMNEGGVPDSKIVLGYMTQPHPDYSASPPDGQVIADAYLEAERQHPGVRVFLWEDRLQEKRGWQAFRKLAPLVNR